MDYIYSWYSYLTSSISSPTLNILEADAIHMVKDVSKIVSEQQTNPNNNTSIITEINNAIVIDVIETAKDIIVNEMQEQDLNNMKIVDMTDNFTRGDTVFTMTIKNCTTHIYTFQQFSAPPGVLFTISSNIILPKKEVIITGTIIEDEDLSGVCVLIDYENNQTIYCGILIPLWFREGQCVLFDNPYFKSESSNLEPGVETPRGLEYKSVTIKMKEK